MSAIATYTARHNTYYTTYVLINDIYPTTYATPSTARHTIYYTTYVLINDICPTSPTACGYRIYYSRCIHVTWLHNTNMTSTPRHCLWYMYTHRPLQSIDINTCHTTSQPTSTTHFMPYDYMTNDHVQSRSCISVVSRDTTSYMLYKLTHSIHYMYYND